MVVVLIGAAERPHVTLMTALPLMWGEGTPADVLAGRSAKSETLRIIETQFDVRAIDTISAKTLGRDIAIIAQPRRLTPEELVAFDKWLLGGGRAMIFADPELVWPSIYALGDTRRAPPVELLDPLFKHWGVTLGDSDQQERMVSINGVPVKLLAAGVWRGPKACTVVTPEVLDCRIGRGRVLLVGDADMLDARLWARNDADNIAWIMDRLRMLGDADKAESTRHSGTMVVGVAVGAIVVAAFIYRHFGGT
jgi:ABC-type uncharacterized transport system